MSYPHCKVYFLVNMFTGSLLEVIKILILYNIKNFHSLNLLFFFILFYKFIKN